MCAQLSARLENPGTSRQYRIGGVQRQGLMMPTDFRTADVIFPSLEQRFKRRLTVTLILAKKYKKHCIKNIPVKENKSFLFNGKSLFFL